MFIFLKHNRNVFLQKNVVGDGDFFFAFGFYVHNKESNIADDTFNNEIFFNNFNVISNL